MRRAHVARGPRAQAPPSAGAFPSGSDSEFDPPPPQPVGQPGSSSSSDASGGGSGSATGGKGAGALEAIRVRRRPGCGVLWLCSWRSVVCIIDLQRSWIFVAHGLLCTAASSRVTWYLEDAALPLPSALLSLPAMHSGSMPGV